MAIVTITPWGRWFCACGNMFGRSWWPLTNEDIDRMTGPKGTQPPCSECGTIHVIGDHRVWINRPVGAADELPF